MVWWAGTWLYDKAARADALLASELILGSTVIIEECFVRRYSQPPCSTSAVGYNAGRQLAAESSTLLGIMQTLLQIVRTTRYNASLAQRFGPAQAVRGYGLIS
jgi:hypothetical protein